MLTFDYKTDPKLDEIDINDATQKSLLQSGYLVSTSGKKNSPYRSGNLRRSINPDFREVSNRKVTVGPNAKYARIQELGGTIRPKKSNYLTWKQGGRWYRAKKVNIKGKFYMLNALRDNETKIYNTFLKNITNEL